MIITITITNEEQTAMKWFCDCLEAMRPLLVEKKKQEYMQRIEELRRNQQGATHE